MRINDVEENINIKCVAHTKLPYCMTSESFMNRAHDIWTNFFGAFYFLKYKLSCMEKSSLDVSYNVSFCVIWKKKCGVGMSSAAFSVTLYFKVSLLQCNYTIKYYVILISNNMYLTIGLWLQIGVGLQLFACNYASFTDIYIISTEHVTRTL